VKIRSGGRDFDTCFITATWRGDLDRFALLRESLRAFGHGSVPHYALINTEDEPLLRELRLPDVSPVTTARLLAPEVEAGRLRYLNAPGGRRWKTFMRSVYKRVGLFADVRYYGWHVQQLAKLEAVVKLPHEVFVCFDSDNVITGRFGLDSFFADGKVVLYEKRAALPAGRKPSDWCINACRLLDLPAPVDHQMDYVNQPVVFQKHAMQALHAWLEKRHGRPWYETLLAQRLGGWSEFITYGSFVRHRLKMEGVFPVLTNSGNLWIYTEAERRNAAELIRRAFRDPAIKLLVLQADDHGHWPLSRFLPVIREELAAAAAGAEYRATVPGTRAGGEKSAS
jgi:hypothetical protein